MGSTRQEETLSKTKLDERLFTQRPQQETGQETNEQTKKSLFLISRPQLSQRRILEQYIETEVVWDWSENIF